MLKQKIMKSIRKVDLITVGRSSIDLYSQNIGSKFEEIKGFDAFVGGSPLNIAVGRGWKRIRNINWGN